MRFRSDEYKYTNTVSLGLVATASHVELRVLWRQSSGGEPDDEFFIKRPVSFPTFRSSESSLSIVFS